MNDTIYDALRESHEIQRSLLRKLLRSKPGTQGRHVFRKKYHLGHAHQQLQASKLQIVAWQGHLPVARLTQQL